MTSCVTGVVLGFDLMLMEWPTHGAAREGPAMSRCEKCGKETREGCSGGFQNGVLCRSYIMMLREIVGPLRQPMNYAWKPTAEEIERLLGIDAFKTVFQDGRPL